MNIVLQTAFIQAGPGSFFADHYIPEQVLSTTVIPFEVPLFSTLFRNDNLISESREYLVCTTVNDPVVDGT